MKSTSIIINEIIPGSASKEFTLPTELDPSYIDSIFHWQLSPNQLFLWAVYLAPQDQPPSFNPTNNIPILPVPPAKTMQQTQGGVVFRLCTPIKEKRRTFTIHVQNTFFGGLTYNALYQINYT